jgi:hypothetical protein
MERDEVNGLRLLRRQQEAAGIKSAYVFVNKRGTPFVLASGAWSSALARPLGCRSRSTSTCCATRLDTHWRAAEWILDGYNIGHASITNTLRYTAMSPAPFKDIWRW